MIYIAIGRRELGKSTLAYFMSQRLTKRAIIDPRRMIRRVSDRIEYVTTIDEAREALIAMMESDESDEVIYQPREDDLEESFVQWARALKGIVVSYPDRELAIMVDEASFYNLEAAPFMWLAKCSLRDYTHIIVTAHQPKDIPTGIRSIADHWFVFYTTQETDLAKIAEKSPDAAREARRLRDRAYVHWDDTKAKLAINPNPSTWFIELQPRYAGSLASVTPDAVAIISKTPLLEE